MQWWNDFVNWFNSDEGWRVISGAVIPFVAIIVAGIIGGLIGRNSTRRLLTWQDRELQSAAVAAIIGVGDRASMWSSLPSGEKDHLDAQMSAADIRLRLLPITGSSAAADWASHELALMQRNSASFSFQAEQSFIDYRDRLLEWQRRPGRARKLFAADLERFRLESTEAETGLVEEQRKWAAEQLAEANRDAPADQVAVAVGAGTAAVASTTAIEQGAAAPVEAEQVNAEPVDAEPVATEQAAEPVVEAVPVVEAAPVVDAVPVADSEADVDTAPADAAPSVVEPEPYVEPERFAEPEPYVSAEPVDEQPAQEQPAQEQPAEEQPIQESPVQPEPVRDEYAETRAYEPDSFVQQSFAQQSFDQPPVTEPTEEPEPVAAPLHEEVVSQQAEYVQGTAVHEEPPALVEPVQLETSGETAQPERTYSPEPFVYEPFVPQPYAAEPTGSTGQAAPAEQAEPVEPTPPSTPASPAEAPPALIMPADPEPTRSLPTTPPTTFGRRVTRPAGSGIVTPPADPNETQPYTGPYPTRDDLS